MGPCLSCFRTRTKTSELLNSNSSSYSASDSDSRITITGRESPSSDTLAETSGKTIIKVRYF